MTPRRRVTLAAVVAALTGETVLALANWRVAAIVTCVFALGAIATLGVQAWARARREDKP